MADAVDAGTGPEPEDDARVDPQVQLGDVVRSSEEIQSSTAEVLLVAGTRCRAAGVRFRDSRSKSPPQEVGDDRLVPLGGRSLHRVAAGDL
jgi:hypothetical protein